MSRRGSAESLDYGFGDDAPRGEGVAEAPTPPAPAVVVPTITVMTEESLERRRRASEVAQATGGGAGRRHGAVPPPRRMDVRRPLSPPQAFLLERSRERSRSVGNLKEGAEGGGGEDRAGRAGGAGSFGGNRFARTGTLGRSGGGLAAPRPGSHVLGGSLPDGLDRSPQGSPKVVPRSWKNTLRRKVRPGKGKTAAELVPDGFSACCMEVPPGVSRCATCGKSW